MANLKRKKKQKNYKNTKELCTKYFDFIFYFGNEKLIEDSKTL